MPDNRVLFQMGAEPWTLATVCLALGLGLLVTHGVLLTLLLVHHGRVRRLNGREASRVAFNTGKTGELSTIHGPAVGVEVRVSFTIGDLRRARQAGDRLVFYGAPAMLMTGSAAFALLLLAFALAISDYVMLVGYVVLVPMFLIACFMPWAAVYTKLE
jgi:hypothetical protein